MISALLCLFLLSVVSAWVLTRKRPEHRGVAILLSVGLGADVGSRLLEVAIIAPLRASLGVATPWTGWDRAAGLAYDALGLVWPAALVAAVLVVFVNRKPWAALAGWAFAILFLASVHPLGGAQAGFLVLTEVAAALISAGLTISWYLERRAANSAQFALTMLVLAEVISLLGAWTLGPFVAWPISQVLYMIGLAMVIIIQGRFLWFSPQLQRSSA